MTGNASVRGRWIYYKIMTAVGILVCLWFVTEVLLNLIEIYDNLKSILELSPFASIILKEPNINVASLMIKIY